MDKRNLDKIYKIRKVIEKDSLRLGEYVRYYLNENDFIVFCQFDDAQYPPEMGLFLDNYPMRRKFYRTNFPIKTCTDLEICLKQVGITLEKLVP